MGGEVTSAKARRAIFVSVGLANLVAAVSTGVAAELALPERTDSLAVRLAITVGGTAVGVGLLALVAAWRWQRARHRLWGWLDEGRQPTTDERSRILAEPWRGAREIWGYWLLAAAGTLVAFLAVSGTSINREAATTVGAILLGGVVATTLSFVLGERAMRPTIVAALSGEPPADARSLRVRRRIFVSWALGSGVPLAWIALLPLLRHPDSSVSTGFLAGLIAVVGVVSGAAFAFLAGRSVGGPVEQVRQGLARVGRGDLDVRVVVDDPGELGLLEAGFNDMVAGLAERRRLHDLFGRHVGEDVARRALDRGVELGGEVLEVSVLFVDLVGSTALAAERPPTEVVELLNRFFEAVVATTSAEGGLVNKFEGDAALCVFGAPEPSADHAARALRAARALAVALEGIDAGIGVSSGDAVAGNVGAESRYEYTVIGHPVNEAARLVEAAKGRGGRVLASDAAVSRAAGESARWHPAGTLDLRGIPQPVSVYEPSRLD